MAISKITLSSDSGREQHIDFEAGDPLEQFDRIALTYNAEHRAQIQNYIEYYVLLNFINQGETKLES